MGDVWLVRHGADRVEPRRPAHLDDRPAADCRTARRRRGRWRRGSPATSFELVLTSPAAARPSYGGAGRLPRPPRSTPDLAEWDYGDYEGITTDEIRQTVPGWTVWTHPCPGGETAERGVGAAGPGGGPLPRRRTATSLLFGHGHCLACAGRALAAAAGGARDGCCELDTGTVSVLGHEREHPVVLRWNS